MTKVQTNIGFADGEILRCERIGSTVVVQIKTWNAKLIQVTFQDVQVSLDLMPGDISGFYCYDEETELMRKALSYAYDNFPKQHPYKHYTFMNNDAQPCLDIVAVGIEISEK